MRRELLFEAELSDMRISLIVDKSSFLLGNHRADERPEAMMGLHSHSFYELFYLPDDSLTMVTEGGIRHFERKTLIIPPRFNHYVTEWAKKGYCFIFALERKARSDGEAYDRLREVLDKGITAVDVDTEISFYMERLAALVSEEDTGEEATHISALLFLSFFKTLRHIESRVSASGVKYRNYVSTIDLYISKHYNERIRIEDIANELHLCTKQVSRIINKEYGTSLSRVIHRHRMSVACMLLKGTPLTVAQIAESVGYEYENYFFRTFREAYGMTPAEYREKFK